MAGNGRNPKSDDVIISALASGLTYREAGKIASVSERTIRRRMEEPAFRDAVYRERDERLERLRRQVVDAAPAALGVLSEISARGTSESSRVASARAVLAFAFDQHSSRLGTIAYSEVERMLGGVVDEGLRRIPPEEHERYLRSVGAIVAPNM